MATNRLERILVQARQLSPEELALLIKQAADLLAQSQQTAAPQKLSYTALFGSGKGSFASPVEADIFVRAERAAWDE
ncbi:MAG: hypothetical protein ACJ74W_18240 [Pyrinomonadaceae bacterium]